LDPDPDPLVRDTDLGIRIRTDVTDPHTGTYKKRLGGMGLWPAPINYSFIWCCYKMVDPETACLRKRDLLNQQMCHILIFFHNICMIKDESNQQNLYVLSNIGFPLKGKLIR
jgi:hypothetical protein